MSQQCGIFLAGNEHDPYIYPIGSPVLQLFPQTHACTRRLTQQQCGAFFFFSAAKEKKRAPSSKDTQDTRMKIALLLLFLQSFPLLCWLMPAADASSPPLDHQAEPELNNPEGGCPPCELLFRRLTTVAGDNNGRRVQDVKMQERGEPKSGTGFMFHWATGSLVHACEYLKSAFGERLE